MKRRAVGGSGGVASVIALLVLLTAGNAVAVTVNWSFLYSSDQGQTGDRWSYTRGPRPQNWYGYNGPPDDGGSGSVLWNPDAPQTAALIASHVGGFSRILSVSALSGMWPTPRDGACLAWDGNVPGWWVGQDNRYQQLVLAGGVNAQGVASSEVNVARFLVYNGIDSVQWVWKGALITPVSYPSCGRVLVRSYISADRDIVGAVFFGGSNINGQQAIAQVVFTNNLQPTTSWTVSQYSVNMGARYGAAIIDQHGGWGPHGGENFEWYLWGGYYWQYAVHCWWDTVFSWVSCEQYSASGSIPPGRRLPANMWSYNPVYADPPWSEGRPLMVIFGGSSGSTYYNTFYYAEMNDATNTFFWVYFPSVSPPSARESATMSCHKSDGYPAVWVDCRLPNAPSYPHSYYFITGGFQGSTQYDNVYRATTS